MRFLFLWAFLLAPPFSLALDNAAADNGIDDSLQPTQLLNAPFPDLDLPDAFGTSYQVPYPSLRHVLFSADMEANELMEASFGELEKGDFTKARLVYVADISNMPSLVARIFAIPSMKQYPFRVLLAREAEQAEMLPREAEAVSVFTLSPQGAVEELRFIRSEQALKALLTP